jgi:hypothetical protein
VRNRFLTLREIGATLNDCAEEMMTGLTDAKKRKVWQAIIGLFASMPLGETEQVGSMRFSFGYDAEFNIKHAVAAAKDEGKSTIICCGGEQAADRIARRVLELGAYAQIVAAGVLVRRQPEESKA